LARVASKQWTVGIATRFDRGTLAFSVSHVTTQSFSPADENQRNTEADGFGSTTFTFTGTHDVTDTFTVGARLLFIVGTSECDSPRSDTGHFFERKQFGARIHAQFDSINIDPEIFSQVFSIDRTDPISAGQTNFEGNRFGLPYRTVDLAVETTLVISADHTQEE
jgi:vitamin B12 transporter